MNDEMIDAMLSVDVMSGNGQKLAGNAHKMTDISSQLSGFQYNGDM